MFKGLKTVFACGSLALALATSLAFVSCDFGLDGNSFQNKAGAYFKEMTSTAAVSAYEISPSDNPVNKDGVACVSSDQDCVVTFYLRNPQKYRFNAPGNMTLALKGLDSYSGVEIEQDILDSSKITVTYSAKFLFDHPMGTDISPLVTLYHPVSHSDFGTYTELPLSSDNPPPTPSGAVCMQSSDNPSRWVLCFDFPKSPLIKSIHRDLKKIEINGVSYDVGVDAEGNISYAAGSAISSARPAGLVANQNTGMSFVSSGQSAYYATGDAADENEKIYDITVYDNAGLSSNMKVSARGFKLSPAAAFLTTDTSYSNPFDTDVTRKNAVPQEDDGSAHIRIKADAFTSSVTYIDKDGNTRTIDSQPYDPSNAYILYEVYEDEAMTKLLGAGKLNGLTGLVTVPAGTSFVKAYVQKPLYSDSEPIVWNCRAVCANLFVASYGSDDNAGSKASPLASIKKAVQKFEEGISVGDYDGTSGAVLTAQLMTDISVSEHVAWDHPGTDDPKFKIAGYGERRTLDMAGNSDALLVSGGTALAENVRFYRASYSAVTLAHASSKFICSGCAFEDCSNTGASGGAITVNDGWLEARTSSFERCKSLYDPGGMGGAVFVSGSGYADFEGCSIKNCYSVGDGSAIYCGGSLRIAACTITENTTQGDTGGAVYYQGPPLNFTLDAGQSYIYGNKSLSGKEIDVHLTDGSGGGNVISISGSLAGSQIGVYRPFNESSKPTTGSPVMFTSGWSATNSGMKPGEVFISNTEYGIAEAGTGTTEAAFAVGGGSMYNAFDYTFTMTKAAAAPEAMYPGMAVSYDVYLEVLRKEPTGSDTTMYLNPADLMLYTYYPPYTGRDGDAAAILKAELYIGSRLVDDNLTVAASDGKLTVAVPAQTYPDNYRIKLIVSYLGLSHTASFSLPCNKSAEAAAAYIQSLRAAGDYNVVVEGPVGPGVDNSDGNETTITSSDEGLAKVAKAIRAKNGSDVKISLDARATSPRGTTLADLALYNDGKYFMNCLALTAARLPDWMLDIVDQLFEGCANLASVTLGANIEYIGASAFKGCGSLASITLPESVTDIAAGAFVGCADGFKIDFAGTKEQWKSVVRPNQTTTDWHDGAKDTREDDGSVTCTDGKCGFDYKSAPTNPLEIPLTIEAGDTAVTITYWNKFDDGSVTYKKSDGSEGVIPYNPNGSPMMVDEVASDGYEITLQPGEKVEFYADKKKHGTRYGQGSIECNADCYVYGNIMSLYDSNNFATCVTLADEATFAGFFTGNTHIKNKAGKPLLLPATTLSAACYENMFYGCTNITSAPDLPATTLPLHCYSCMFRDCTKLQSAPDIAATTVSEMCCYCMFDNCTELVTGPVLRAQNLARQCYQQMFQDCEKLTSVTCLATWGLSDDEAFASLSSWLNGTAKDTTGTLTRASGVDWSGNIPSNWTVTP